MGAMYKKNHEVVEINDDHAICNIIIGFYYAVIINNVAKRMLDYYGNAILIAALIPVFVYCLKYFAIIKRHCLNTIVTSEFVVFILYLFSFLFGTPQSIILKYIVQTSVFVFFGGIVYGIDDYNILAESMKKHSYNYLIILSLIYLKKGSFTYVMSHSYLMLLPTLLHITMFLYEKEKKEFHFLIIVYELYTIITLGSRGPLLVIFVYVLVVGFISLKKVSTKVFLILSFVLLYYFIFIDGDNTYRYIQSLGINSRTLSLIFQDKEYDSGRSEIAQKGIELIQQKPLWGWGVAGDSQFIKNGYVHNLFLELKIDYGIIIGTILYISLWTCYIKALIKTKFTWIYVMIICNGIIPLFFSNSYLLSYDFIISFFMVISILIKNKRNQNLCK